MVKNLLLILPIIFLILNQTSQKEKSIFDETQIKKMKLKNRSFPWFNRRLLLFKGWKNNRRSIKFL